MGKGPELPDGADFADEIDSWLRAGAKPYEPPLLTPEQIEKQKEFSGSLSRDFIEKYFGDMPRGDIRFEAKKIHENLLHGNHEQFNLYQKVEALTKMNI